MFQRTAKLTIAFALLAGTSAACAPARPAASADDAMASETSSTSAELAAAEPRESAPEGATPPAPAADAPAGTLACRAKTPDGATKELYLEWDKGTAKGVLRTIAQSGETRDLRVRAERYKGMIVADDPNAADLVTHAAMVAEQNGKKQMRAGETSPAWSDCD